MKKYRLECIIFAVNVIYMILELIASHLLSPHFGSSNLVWTSVIGIILLSSSLGNFLGGMVADKNNSKNNVKVILALTGVMVLWIPLMQGLILQGILQVTSNIKIGAIIATLFLFFIPSMLIGMLSPIMIKLKLEDLTKAGKTSGRIYATATLGSIVGTFLGGFYLIPNFGSKQILYVLAIVLFCLILLVEDIEWKKRGRQTVCMVLACSMISGILLWTNICYNKKQAELVAKGEIGAYVSYDTQYGNVGIYNLESRGQVYRVLSVGKGFQSGSFVDEEQCNELVFEYTRYYDKMFEVNTEIKDTLMIGGAGYSYPKYYISHYPEKRMDVVEIDEGVTKIAKEYFYLNKLIEDYKLEENGRLQFIAQDGRVYLNQNEKKYDAILNDAFSGEIPAKTLTTLEAVQTIYDSLNPGGAYLSNIIASIEGEDAEFLKAEVQTLKQIFKNVYVVPCNYKEDLAKEQNVMVIATDKDCIIEEAVHLDMAGSMILTDDTCPVEQLIRI